MYRHRTAICRCSFRRLLSINALQSDGSSAVSVWPLTWFRRWIRGGIVVQVLVWLEWWCYSSCFFVLSMYPKSLFCLLCMKFFLLTLLWAKIAIFVGYLMDGWRIFVSVLFESSTVYKALSSKKCRISTKVSSKRCNQLLQSKLFFFINISYNK